MPDHAGLAVVVAEGMAIGVEAVGGRGELEVVPRVDAQDHRIRRIDVQDVVDDPVPVVEQVGGRDPVVDADPRAVEGILVEHPFEPGQNDAS